ncbi:MAG: hypothetical protein ABJ215_00480 [Alphaproteobacteria bacterium]
MEPINPEQANNEFGIFTRHEKMPNGEHRFRLKKSDGTAYIRTEAGLHGAWQESHFHLNVRETYIVQSGWIAYAEEQGGRFTIEIFRPGELFTTQIGIVHNVYMSAGSVIHTVKHGSSQEDDRHTHGTQEFDAKCRRINTDSELLDYVANNPKPSKNDSVYSSEYRHFDGLIWQVPAWVTAIFALTTGALGSQNLDAVANMTKFSASSLTVVFLLIVAGTIFCFSHVMFRFRMHQKTMKRYSRTPIWASASSWTQLLINIQASALLALALVVAGAEFSWALLFSLSILAAITILFECLMRTK